MAINQVRIRAATLEDAVGIARVQVDGWRTSYTGIVPQDYLDALTYEKREMRWRENLAQDKERHCLYVAEVSNTAEIVGFASGGVEQDGHPLYQGEVYAIYLLAVYQRQGIGRRLVRSVADWLLAHGYRSMIIWVLAANPARGFYATLGGQPVGEKIVTIGGAALPEVGYGWPDLTPLLEEDRAP